MVVIDFGILQAFRHDLHVLFREIEQRQLRYVVIWGKEAVERK